jgi:hypothetical protein
MKALSRVPARDREVASALKIRAQGALRWQGNAPLTPRQGNRFISCLRSLAAGRALVRSSRQHRPPNFAGRITPQTAQLVKYQWDALAALLLEDIDRPVNPCELVKAIDAF